MDLEELQAVQTKERQKDSLQHLRDTFYEDVARYIAELREERDRLAESVEDPYGHPEVQQLTDEIGTAENVAEAIYERRVGKVVTVASFAAADMPVDREGMTDHEQDLFEDLVERIEGNKEQVLEILSGETEPAEPTTPSPGEHVGDGKRAAADTPPEAVDVSDGGDADGPAEPALGLGEDESTAGSPPEQADSESGVSGGTDGGREDAPDADDVAGEAGLGDDRTTVRITDDVGTILGVDEREYELASEDVVSLPAENAEPLLQRDAAERLD